MSRKEMIASAVDHLRTRAGVKAVYGEPVVIDGKTIIPVASVTLDAAVPGTMAPQPHQDDGPEPATAGTANGAGAVAARPVGVVEISANGTRFVSFGQTKRLAFAAAIGSGVGAVIGWMLGRRTNGGT